MFVPWFAWPLAMQLIAAADGVPKLDVTPSCQGAAKSGYISTTENRLKSCIDSEMRTRQQLEEQWSGFPVADRTDCYASIRGFQPTYSELATCLEMKRDLRNVKPVDGDAPAAKPASRRR
jgi:hypothetical protein